MTEKPQKPAGASAKNTKQPTAKAKRKQALSQALRENLKRRKAPPKAAASKGSHGS